MPRGCRQAYCVKRLIRSPTPKPMSSPTLCSVLEKWEMIPLRPGAAKLNGIRKNHFEDMNRMPTEFEWKQFTGITALGDLRRFKKLMTDLQCEPENFKGRIFFMPMYSDIAWQEKGNKERCEYNSQTVANCARKFPRGHWSFLRPASEEKWYGTYTDKPDASWNRASIAFERGEFRSKGGGKKSIHFNDRHENIELLLRTVISANHLSIHGAIADLCDELPKGSRAPGNLQHLIVWKRWKFLPTSLLQKILPMHSNSETKCIRAKIRTFVRRPEIIQTMF